MDKWREALIWLCAFENTWDVPVTRFLILSQITEFFCRKAFIAPHLDTILCS